VANGLCKKCYDELPENKERATRKRRLKKYGLTHQEYDQLLRNQEWKCAICGGEPEAVDHDHETGVVRGLLCIECNAGIGLFADSRDRLHSAIRYLTSPPARGDGDWVQTYTGRAFWPFCPMVEDIDILDIAHGLAMKCRFSGHTAKFYSVAQHSVLVSRMVPEKDRLWGLLHDAAEAYLADVAKPIKSLPEFAPFRAAEEKLMRVIAKRFGLSWPEPESVKVADVRALATERRDLMLPPPKSWKSTERVEPFAEKLFSWTPTRAEAEFLEAWDQLSCPANSASASQPIPTTASDEPALSSAARRA